MCADYSCSTSVSLYTLEIVCQNVNVPNLNVIFYSRMFSVVELRNNVDVLRCFCLYHFILMCISLYFICYLVPVVADEDCHAVVLWTDLVAPSSER